MYNFLSQMQEIANIKTILVVYFFTLIFFTIGSHEPWVVFKIFLSQTFKEPAF